jgi:DnaK suppressor protein
MRPSMQTLEPLERLRLRDLLQDLWRADVEQITALAVRFHSIESDQDRIHATGAEVAEQLATVRLDLTEIESAMHRMDAGEYGRCAWCGRAIRFDELSAIPHRRGCAACAASEPTVAVDSRRA